MKKVLSIMLITLLVICSLQIDLVTLYTKAETVNKIYTVLDLWCVRNDLTANYILMNDIDLTDATKEGGDYDFLGNGWKPIGADDSYSKIKRYSGVFDGKGHKIIGMRIDIKNYTEYNEPTDSYYLGLFAGVEGTVKNLIMENSLIKITEKYSGGDLDYHEYHGDYYVGTIAGICNGIIKNVCCESGSIESLGGHIGGLVGYQTVGQISFTKSNIKINKTCYSCNSEVGGIVGFAENSDINCSYNCGSINDKGNSDVGGIAGVIRSKATFSQSGNVTATGGITVLNCCNSGAIESSRDCSDSYYVSGIVGKLLKSLKADPPKIKNCYNVAKVFCFGTFSTSFDAPGYGITYAHSNGYGEVSNSYYIKGNVGWYGTTELSDQQMKNQKIYSGFDFDNIWTMQGDKNYPYPELKYFTLRGEPVIVGDIVYNSTVTVSTEKIENPNEFLKYSWYIDGLEVGKGQSYKLKADDIGKKLKLEIISLNPMSIGSVFSEEFTVEKGKQPDSPIKPDLLELSDSKIEITTVPTQEYSIDNKNWQKNGVFDNLQPNKKYTIYSRIIENDLYLTGESEKVLEVTTEHRPISGKVIISGSAGYNDTVTAELSITPSNATFSYEWKSGSTVLGTGKTYTIKKSDIGKNISVSVKGTGDFIGTVTSAFVTATKTTVNSPNAPIVDEVTNTTVELICKSGYEYKMDNGEWQSSNVFAGLAPNSTHKFYQRIAETDSAYASEPSEALTVTTLKNTVNAPSAPIVLSKTANSVTLKGISGYEYKMDNGEWQSSNVFTGLAPNSTHKFYQRIAETDTAYASEPSEALTVTTLKNTVNAPSAPTVLSKTANSVTLKDISGYEYSADGKVWQKSNVFTGLTEDTEYTFYQRIAETDTTYVSESSAPLKVKTDKSYTPGDLDGDEGITDSDVLYLLKHTFRPEKYPVNQPCDYNGDGEITDADAVYLLKHIFRPEKYPLTK